MFKIALVAVDLAIRRGDPATVAAPLIVDAQVTPR